MQPLSQTSNLPPLPSTNRFLGWAGGDRTHDRKNMRWMQSVGMVRRCRFGLWDQSCDCGSQCIREMEPICRGFRRSFKSNDQLSGHQEGSNPMPRACTGNSLTTVADASIDQRRRLRFVARHRRTLPGKRRYQRRRSIQVQTQISKRSCRC
jgi:hypothetical protein